MGQYRDMIQGMAALHTRLAKMDGHKIDKKAARYSAMADYCQCVAMSASEPVCQLSYDVLWEAVATAIEGDPQNILGQPFDRSAWIWMEHVTPVWGQS